MVDLPAFQGPFDAAFFNAVFGNVADQKAALTAAALLLKPGGNAVVSHPLGRPWLQVRGQPCVCWVKARDQGNALGVRGPARRSRSLQLPAGTVQARCNSGAALNAAALTDNVHKQDWITFATASLCQHVGFSSLIVPASCHLVEVCIMAFSSVAVCQHLLA